MQTVSSHCSSKTHPHPSDTTTHDAVNIISKLFEHHELINIGTKGSKQFRRIKIIRSLPNSRKSATSKRKPHRSKLNEKMHSIDLFGYFKDISNMILCFLTILFELCVQNLLCKNRETKHEFKVGDVVELTNLKKKKWNGKSAVIISQPISQIKKSTRSKKRKMKNFKFLKSKKIQKRPSKRSNITPTQNHFQCINVHSNQPSLLHWILLILFDVFGNMDLLTFILQELTLASIKFLFSLQKSLRKQGIPPNQQPTRIAVSLISNEKEKGLIKPDNLLPTPLQLMK